MQIYYSYFQSPIGELLLVGQNEKLKKISFPIQHERTQPEAGWVLNDNAFRKIVDQLNAYFSKKIQTFDIDLLLEGTPFQKRVWRALQDIPYGETASYQDIAVRVGSPHACRAVGMANRCNPLPIIIPCHRVIGKNGKLTGFAGGLDTKSTLLRLERQH